MLRLSPGLADLVASVMQRPAGSPLTVTVRTENAQCPDICCDFVVTNDSQFEKGGEVEITNARTLLQGKGWLDEMTSRSAGLFVTSR
jgi:hypothetical protein